MILPLQMGCLSKDGYVRKQTPFSTVKVKPKYSRKPYEGYKKIYIHINSNKIV